MAEQIHGQKRKPYHEEIGNIDEFPELDPEEVQRRSQAMEEADRKWHEMRASKGGKGGKEEPAE